MQNVCNSYNIVDVLEIYIQISLKILKTKIKYILKILNVQKANETECLFKCNFYNHVTVRNKLLYVEILSFDLFIYYSKT